MPLHNGNFAVQNQYLEFFVIKLIYEGGTDAYAGARYN